MKFPQRFFLGQTIIDALGLLALLSLFAMNAFHFNIYETYSYYREFFGGIFCCLIFLKLLVCNQAMCRASFGINRVLFYLLLFPALLALWSLFDSNVPLYGQYFMEYATTQVGDASLSLYVLRNATLYLPMVIYFYLRGLNKKEVHLIATTAIVVAPFSIEAYLVGGEFASLLTLGRVAEMGGGLSYNTYVPYLTFSVLCGIFLLFSDSNVFIKLIVLPCVIITTLFCIFSTSRQSVVFILLCLITFLYYSNGNNSRISRWLIFSLLILAGAVVFFYTTRDYELAENFVGRFGSVDGFATQDTSVRFDLFLEGLSLLKPLDWIFGSGLTSVMVSGPHTDYVRWTQRVGLPLMIFGFIPFFMAIRKCYSAILVNRTNNSLLVLVAMAVGFTIFHSIFGYPREDSNQAVAVYLGLSLWFGALKGGILR